MFRTLFLLTVVGVLATATPPGDTRAELRNKLKTAFAKIMDHGYTRKDHDEEILGHLDTLRHLNLFPERVKIPKHPEGAPSRQAPLHKEDLKDKSVICDLCNSIGDLLIGALLIDDVPLDLIENTASELCVALEIEAEPVCRDVVKLYAPYLAFLVKRLGAEDAQSELFCGLNVDESCLTAELTDTINGWTVDIPEGAKPPFAEPGLPEAGSPTVKVLHLTDVHLDLSYQPGTVTNCGLPMCCMNWTEMAPPGVKGAGYWGDTAECDMPLWTFDEMMRQIGEKHQDLDYIMFTGDAPAHDIWMQTKQANFVHSEELLKSIKTHLPDLPFYMTLGNHEGCPVNSFPTSELIGSEYSGEWLYRGIANIIANDLPGDAQETFDLGGYYAIRPFPGFKLINVNNNFGAKGNLLTYLNFNDPAGQLAWLVRELQDSEEKGEKVHIMTHHPNRGPLHKGWRREYARVVRRYENIVKATFVGHTHKDNFEVWLDENNSATMTTLVGPSVVPRGNKSPEYRIYTFDGGYEGASYQLLDYESYLTNVMDYEGPDDPPQFNLYYKASEAYGMSRFWAEDWYDLLKRAMLDDDLFQKMRLIYAQNIAPEEVSNDNHAFLCGKIQTPEENASCPL